MSRVQNAGGYSKLCKNGLSEIAKKILQVLTEMFDDISKKADYLTGKYAF